LGLADLRAAVPFGCVPVIAPLPGVDYVVAACGQHARRPASVRNRVGVQGPAVALLVQIVDGVPAFSLPHEIEEDAPWRWNRGTVDELAGGTQREKRNEIAH
jgi:hypothetical protein